jgi:hypothetical protein
MMPWDTDQYLESGHDGFMEWMFHRETGKFVTDETYDEWSDWSKNFESPIIVENCCSGKFPMHVFLVPNTRIMAMRGSPTILDPHNLSSRITADSLDKFLAFLSEFETAVSESSPWEENASWILFSYWG